jgi:transposase
MSGQKGMKHYGTVILDDVKSMKVAGATNREIAEHFNLKDKTAVKGLLRRDKKKQEKLELGIAPRRRGRPPKGYIPKDADKDNEIKRLKMENELLRDFLRIAGRK